MRAVYKIFLSVLIIAVAPLSCACGGESSELQETTTAQITPSTKATENQTTEEPATENITEQPTTENNNVELNNTYTTKLTEIGNVTYPAFTFDYPDNWTITDEAIGDIFESVTLENDNGAIIWFSHISGKKGENIGGGSGTNMARIEVSEVSDSQFVPDAANKNLGEFMVAKLKTTGVLDMKTDSQYTNVDGNVSYAVLPKSDVGLREEVTKAVSGEFTFYYGANISFVGTDNGENFTEEEQQEVIEILNSFRLA